MVRAQDLAARSWGAVEHFPGVPSEEGRRLEAAYQRAKAVHDEAPDEGSAAILAILADVARKRSRSRPANYADRAAVLADRELFTRIGLLKD
ncbi:hypothetical protein BZZ08_01623 [Streptomyces sp. MH60]|nr:hypothetical protein BZZ08_01623 [Streptomyces sp. MH60]